MRQLPRSLGIPVLILATCVAFMCLVSPSAPTPLLPLEAQASPETTAEKASSDTTTKQAEHSIRSILSAVHFEFDPVTLLPRLEQAANGREPLIDILLKLRLHPTSPFLPLRAEQILIEYATEQRVAEALLEDYTHPGRKGLAKIIQANMNRLPAELQQVLSSSGQAK